MLGCCIFFILPPLVALLALYLALRSKSAEDIGRLWLVVAFVLGSVAGLLLGFPFGVLLVHVLRIPGREGEAGYFVFLGVLPWSAVAGAVCGLAVPFLLHKRR
jgi:hypothetical protein